MRTVRQFPMRRAAAGTTQEVQMPAGAEVIHAENWSLWAIVATNEPISARRFLVTPSNIPIPSLYGHVATFRDGAALYHVFEEDRDQFSTRWPYA